MAGYGNSNSLGDMGGSLSRMDTPRRSEFLGLEVSKAGQEGALYGGLSGAAIGSAAGPYGAAAGFVIGATIGYIKGDEAGDAAQTERERLEALRTAQVMREYGIMQQKASYIQNAPRARNAQSRSTRTEISGNDQGAIGQNLINTGGMAPSSAGTF